MGRREIRWHLVLNLEFGSLKWFFGKVTTMREALVLKTGIVVNYGDCIFVAYILWDGILENFKLQLGYQLHWASCTQYNRKAVSLNIPLTTHSFTSAYAVAKRTQSAALGGLRPRVPVCRTDAQGLCDPPLDESRRKSHSVLGGRTQNEPCAPYMPLHIRWMVCGTSTIPDSAEMI
jgi:hypothetical protein